MNRKKRFIRYLKRVFYPTISGCIAFFLVKGINFILNNLEPGWLVVFLMPIVQVILPLYVAFRSFCIQMYKEAEEDGELEEILKTTSPLFKRRVKISPPSDVELSDTPPEEESYTVDHCSAPEPHEPCSHEKEPKPIVPQIIAEEESKNEQKHVSESTIDTIHSETRPEPTPETPPVLDEQLATKESECKLLEPFTPLATTENTSDRRNDDIDAEEAPNCDQEPDIFDCIRDPEIMAHYIVLDIETTGFSRDNDRIIEIAAIHYVFGEEAKRFHTYINPQMPIPKHITRLTGIHQHNVDDAPLIEDIADDFCEFIKDYPLVGHNIINFDLPFLEKHLPLDEPHFTIDTLDMARAAFPLLPTHKLSDLNFWFRLDNGSPHRADADAAATNALMWACLYPEKYESLYRKAIRNGPPEDEQIHKSRIHHHFEQVCTTEISPSPNRNDKSLPLHGKRIVFTGELSIARNNAMQMAVDAGALLRTSVSSKTDILVVGKQDVSVVGTDGMSTKQEKAQEINASGKGSIKIVDEAEFISMIYAVPESDRIEHPLEPPRGGLPF